MLDLRPLQGGDAARGIGTSVRGLAGALPGLAALVWRRRPVPAEAERRRQVRLSGPGLEGRLGWAADGLAGMASSWPRRGGLIHLTSMDASFAVRRPYVVTVHDAIPWRFPDLYPAGPTGRVRMEASARLARRAEAVVVPSRASAVDAEEFLGVRPERVHVIPWAADPAVTAALVNGKDAIEVGPPARLELPPRYVLVAGGFAHADPRKRLVDAVAALSHLPGDVVLAVTGGRGPAEASFQAGVEQLGLTRRVRLTGHLPAGELGAVMKAAAAVVFPSAWEGFGLPLLDALALGVPVVTSGAGSLREVGGDAVLYHDVGDVAGLAARVNELLDDPAQAAAMVERGRSRAGEFSWERTGAAYRDLYAELGTGP